MKKWMMALGLIIMTLSSMSVLFAEDDSVEYFKEMRENLYSSLPDSFAGKLTGASIEDKLDTIPEDYIESGGAYVELSFSKTDGVDIEVQNVDFLYRDLFEQYVRFFTLGPVLSTQSEDAVLARYEITTSVDSSAMVVLNLRYQSADNNFDIYVDTDSYQITRVDYFLDEEMLSTIIINYEDLGEYSVPAKFFVKTFEGGIGSLEVFEIDEIEVN